jgi:hypothetical protein
VKRPILLIACGVLVSGLCATDVMAHGFALPPSAGAGFGVGGGNSNASSNTGTVVAPANPTTPESGVRSKNGTGGSTPRNGGSAGATGTGARSKAKDAAAKNVDASSTSPDALAAGAEFKALLVSDAALLKDRSVLLEANCLDSALRRVDLRIKLQELRVSAADVKRRVDVETKVDGTWELNEVFFLRDSAIHRWTREGGLKKLSSTSSEIALAGSAIMMSDILPFDASGYSFAFKRAQEVDFVAHETYTVKPSEDGLVRGVVTFRSDLRCPTHMEVTKSAVRTRAYDWSGWRYVSGSVVPSRIAVLGASLEPVASMEVREANVNQNIKADIFDPAKGAGGEVVSAGR